MSDFSTLLLTTDFSEVSAGAVPTARALAGKLGASILLVYVQEDRVPPFLDELLGDREDMLRRQRQRAAEELQRFGRQHLGDAVPWTTEVAVGIPHEEIVKLAQARKAGLIVMATHGRSPLGHALIGSTAERVLHRATCPVLTVRVPRER